MAALFARLWLSRSVTDPVGLTVAKPFTLSLPTRRSRTVRCKCHAWRPYQPFQCAAQPMARKGVTGPAGHRLLAGLARRSRLRRVVSSKLAPMDLERGREPVGQRIPS